MEASETQKGMRKEDWVRCIDARTGKVENEMHRGMRRESRSCAHRQESQKSPGLPIPADGRAGMLKIAKISTSFLQIDHADP